MNVNKKVRELYINNKYYFKYKRKKTKQNYWNKSKDPDGIIRYKISEKERKQFIKNNISLIKTIKFLNINNLIDIGCGAGYLLSALKKYKSFGVDNNSLALKQTSKYSKIFNKDLNKKNLNINKKFDLVICYHVMEHLKSPENLMNNIIKITKKNGYLIVGTPDFDCLMARIYKNKFRLLHDKTHISLFSLDSMKRFIRDKGFKILDIDFPYFETDYYNQNNLKKLFKKKSYSPPFYGNIFTILAQKS